MTSLSKPSKIQGNSGNLLKLRKVFYSKCYHSYQKEPGKAWLWKSEHNNILPLPLGYLSKICTLLVAHNVPIETQFTGRFASFVRSLLKDNFLNCLPNSY